MTRRSSGKMKRGGATPDASPTDETDYSEKGLTIAEALIDAGKRTRPPGRPPTIQWGAHQVSTVDVIPVPQQGRIRLEFVRATGPTKQGADLVIKNGGFRLADGRLVSRLRTWNDPNFEPFVEYDFVSPSGEVRTLNVYLTPDGCEEYATGNAGCWVEQLAPGDRLYHCSHRDLEPPDFEALVYRVRLLD